MHKHQNYTYSSCDPPQPTKFYAIYHSAFDAKRPEHSSQTILRALSPIRFYRGGAPRASSLSFSRRCILHRERIEQLLPFVLGKEIQAADQQSYRRMGAIRTETIPAPVTVRAIRQSFSFDATTQPFLCLCTIRCLAGAKPRKQIKEYLAAEKYRRLLVFMRMVNVHPGQITVARAPRHLHPTHYPAVH